MNKIAMIIGYAVIFAAFVLLVISSSSFHARNGVYSLILLGFGFVVLDGGVERIARLIKNLNECGWSFLIAGRFAIGWSNPRWFNRIVLRRNGRRT